MTLLQVGHNSETKSSFLIVGIGPIYMLLNTSKWRLRFFQQSQRNIYTGKQ